MNEITTFCDGECPNISYEPENDIKLPFSPTGDKYLITNFSISLDGQHYFSDPKDQKHNTEFNMHSLYGTMQAKATYEFWNAPTALQTRRPFILSRSTFAGAGKWTAHWLGDNWSSWSYMQFSISGIMDFNIFGIPLVGADV